jgi:hypothetical protein
VNINDFKNDISHHKFNRELDIDDTLGILLIEDSSGIESIPLEMIHGYYLFKGHICIFMKTLPHINIAIKEKYLKQAV